jgi:hypothetical protein
MATIVTRIGKGSALTFLEVDDNFENLNTDKIEAVADDTDPVLGGDLNVDEYKITTTSSTVPLTIEAYQDAGYSFDVETNSLNGSAPVININGILAVDDSLGLGINGITTQSDSIGLYLGVNLLDATKPSIVLDNSGSISMVVEGADTPFIELTAADGSVQIQGLLYPNADGTVGQVLTTDGEGNLTFEDAGGGGISAVEDDTAPLLGGDLGVNSFRIVSVDDDIQLVAEETTVGPNVEKSSITISYDNGISLHADDGITLTADNSSLVLTAVEQPSIGDDGTTSITLTHTGVITVVGDLDVTNAEMVSASNGNIVITPNGTGATKTKNINYNEKIHSLGTTSGTITPDVENGNVQTITLNGNLTFSAFSNPVAGQSITLIVNTGGTSRTLTSTMKFAGADKTISTTNTTDIISVFYDGTTYWASLSKGFA